MCGKLSRNLGLAALAGLSFASSAIGATVYSTGFESPTFSTGSINGQDGWTGDGSIQTASAMPGGAQAFRVTSPSSGSAGATQPLNIDLTSPGRTVTVEADYRHDGTPITFGLALLGNGNSVGQIGNGNNGAVLTNSNSWQDFPTPLSPGTWHHVVWTLDFASLEMAGVIDSTSMGSYEINTTSTIATGFQFYTSGTSSSMQDIYLDNLTISTFVPEPASLGVLCFTTTGLLARRHHRA